MHTLGDQLFQFSLAPRLPFTPSTVQKFRISFRTLMFYTVLLFHWFGTTLGTKWQEKGKKNNSDASTCCLDPRNLFPGSFIQRVSSIWAYLEPTPLPPLLQQCSIATGAGLKVASGGKRGGKRGGCPFIPIAHSKSFVSVLRLERKDFSWTFFNIGVHWTTAPPQVKVKRKSKQ